MRSERGQHADRLCSGVFRRTLGMLPLALLWLAAALPASAADVCVGQQPGFQVLDPGDDESGVGGTGVRTPDAPRRGSDDESGIGGTGRAPGGDDGSGIGGTGRAPGGDDESGVGGTGLFGVVTAVDTPRRTEGGSAPRSSDAEGPGRSTRVCLNGVEVAVPETLALESSGGDAGSRGLAAGQVAYVVAVRTDQGLVARRVVIAEAHAGQVEVVLDGGRSLIVSGRRVRVADEAARDPALGTGPIEAGRWIRVHGQRQADGRVWATRLASGRRGDVREPKADLEAQVARWLEARPLDYVSVEGFVRSDAGRRRVGALEITWPGERPTLPTERLRPGARVRIGGRLAEDRTLRVAPPPRWLARPGPGRNGRPGLEAPAPLPPETPPQTRPPKPTTKPPRARPMDSKPRPPDVIRPTRPPRVRDAIPQARPTELRSRH